MVDQFNGDNEMLRTAIWALLNNPMTSEQDFRSSAVALLSVAHDRLPLGGVTEGYMCKVDYEDELGYANSNIVYASEAAVRQRKCVEQCGIVKVGVTLLGVVQEDNFPTDDDLDRDPD